MKYVAVFFLALLVSSSSSPVFAQVRLNEILGDPARDWDGDAAVGSKEDEWVEVINLGSVPVDMTCYRLTDASGGFTWRYGFSGTLAPGEVRVVYGSDALAWQSANGFPSFGLSLNNSGDTVFLYDTAEEDTVIVDEYTYAAFEAEDDRSTGRPEATPGEWEIFDGLNPYTGTTPPLGNGCVPTPGASNECQPAVPVEGSTWGAIKNLFSS